MLAICSANVCGKGVCGREEKKEKLHTKNYLVQCTNITFSIAAIAAKSGTKFFSYFLILQLRRDRSKVLNFLFFVVVFPKDLPKQSVVNGSVPTSTRRNSCDGITSKKPPVPPMPYGTKSASLPKKPPRDLANGGLKDQSFSPIKKEGIISASTPDLSLSSSKSDDSPGTNSIKTSTPDTKSRRRVAPPPPPRPAVPKALFTEGKPATQANGLPVKTPTPAARTTPSQAPTVNPTPMLRSNTSQAPPANDAKVKPRVKKRPAPPRPVRPPPPQTARQSSTESKDSKGSEDGSDRKRAVNTQFKQDMEVTSLDRASLSLDIEPPSYDYQDKGGEEDDWRGAPIFIPPPPPDELPPPLDECETPVGPLTDYEAGILEGNKTIPNKVDYHVTCAC